jgi:uncharacterized protein YybS (DUF2232 family)
VQVGQGFAIWFLCLGTLVLGFIGAALNPVAYLFMGILAPLPVLVVGWRFGMRAVALLVLAVVALLFCLRPGWDFLGQNLGFLNLLLLGVLLSGFRSRGMPAPQAIAATVAALILIALLLLLGQALYQGVTPQAILARKSQEILQTVRQVLGESGGAPEPMIPGVAQADVENFMLRLLPGLIITNMGLVAWINIILCQQVAVLLGGQMPETPLFYWTAPEWLIFVLLGAGFLLLIPVQAVRLVSLNLLMVVALCYFCQGVAVVASWFHRLRLPRFLRIIGYPLLFLNPFFIVIITLGLIDLWLDFRKLYQPKDA